MHSFKLTTLSLILCAINFGAFAQKKKIDAEAYDEWNRIENIRQSEKGNVITYEINPLEGDSELYIKAKSAVEAKLFPRGGQAEISQDESFVAFTIAPQFDTIRQLKLDKVKKIKFPKDTLAVYWVAKDSIAKYPNVASFKVAEEGSWMAYLSTKDLRPKLTKKQLKKLAKKGLKKQQTSGKTLFLFNPTTGKKRKLSRVKDYTFNRTGNLLAYTSSLKGKVDSISLSVFDLNTMKVINVADHHMDIKKMRFDYAGNQLVFLNSLDTGETKNYTVSYWKRDVEGFKTLVDSTTTGMPEGFTASQYFAPHFSRDGKRIYLGTNEILRAEPEDTLLDSEKAKVDVWGGSDLSIQPQQLKNLKREQNKTYKAVYHLYSDEFVQLANEELESIRTMNFSNADFALGTDSRKHDRERNWAFPWKQDYYMVNVENGAKKLLKEGLEHNASLSPSGEFFVWYNGADSSWMSTSTKSNQTAKLTQFIDADFADKNNGMPFTAYPAGAEGWSMHNGKEYYVVNTFYDIWFLCPSDITQNFALTDQKMKRSKMRYSLFRLERDSLYLSLDRCLVLGVDDNTKDESIHEIVEVNGKFSLNQLLNGPHKITYLKKAKESDDVILRRQSFTQYPDIETTDMTFKSTSTITNANPQQEEYNWGTVEMVDWTAYDSTALRGLLYKPEDFDSTKKYPMIVYFYEDYTDNIHFYYTPKPTASIIYPTEYVSNGYIVFIPDVAYEAGHPAKSAFNCIVSGTDYLVDKYDWIDSTKLALQGQSWGGYQTAQLITMTDKYKCAMAGAPVSNMFSAYGGIRWGSGMSRMFQYEHTQSRIGATIWERPDLYIENSPIFGLPKVNTPVLIMHNDNDGAVPWYQGIEMYMGLRRLDKEVWLLNYNGDAHNLRKLANKRDLSIRMRQFFDHYLLDAPMPSWMKNGVPATDKGINPGFELEK
ncbi:MAG: prolyl oligopeptidase family serine peptidase [Crocinitomicaceae bacterium]